MMSKEIKELNNAILRVTQSVVVHTPKYSKFGGYDGENDIYTMDIAKALYNDGWRKQSEGEWKIKTESYRMIDDYDEEIFVECPFCQRRFDVPYEFDDEKIFKYAREHYPYCNCGAKMKGGAE